MTRYLTSSLLIGLFFILCQCTNQGLKTSVAPAEGLITDSAMVVSAHPLASAVGADIMRAGGNAVDCRHCRAVCPGGGLPGGGQYRRWWIYGHPAEQWAYQHA